MDDRERRWRDSERERQVKKAADRLADRRAKDKETGGGCLVLIVAATGATLLAAATVATVVLS